MKKNNEYCYKIKHAWLKKQRLKNLGYKLYSDEYDNLYWAKNINLSPISLIAQDLKKQVELIFKKGGEEYKKIILESGFEFDLNDNLIINDAFLNGLKAQLCVSINNFDSDRNVLFINIDGMEWYNISYVNDACKDEIEKLLKAKVIYKKLMIVKE